MNEHALASEATIIAVRGHCALPSSHPLLRLSLWLLVACMPVKAQAANAAEVSRSSAPDVLFIVVDDLNDWISLLDADAPIKTPNLQRLAERGVLFTKAYCMSPACNPSRAATLTGLRPTTTGVYGNKSDWRRAVGDRKTIMQHFMTAGYDVRGAGKIFHHHLGGAFHDQASFHNFQPMRAQLYPPKKLNGATQYGSRNTDWGQWPKRVDQTIDYHTTNYCVQALQERDADKPLFLACGIFKPHSPFFAPGKYHEPFGKVKPPLRKPDDWRDLPSGAGELLKDKQWFWRGMMQVEKKRQGAYLDFIRAYAACATLADEQIGRVLDALEKSPRRDRTIVVLWSDHGFHLGEKDHIEKFALWEKATHIPFIVVAPGITSPDGRCDRPVDMSVLCPTLLQLCGMPDDPECDGQSIVPLLRNPRHGVEDSRDNDIWSWQPCGTEPALAVHPLRRWQRGVVRPPVGPARVDKSCDRRALGRRDQRAPQVAAR